MSEYARYACTDESFQCQCQHSPRSTVRKLQIVSQLSVEVSYWLLLLNVFWWDFTPRCLDMWWGAALSTERIYSRNWSSCQPWMSVFALLITPMRGQLVCWCVKKQGQGLCSPFCQSSVSVTVRVEPQSVNTEKWCHSTKSCTSAALTHKLDRRLPPARVASQGQFYLCCCT